MKRLLALALCLMLLLTVAAGCGETAPEELNNDRIASDLVRNHHLYAYAHIGDTPTISNLKAEKIEQDNAASVSATATATFTGAMVDIAVTMEYARINGHWKLEKIEATRSSVTVTGAPDRDSVMLELTNYISVVGSAYSVLDETYQPLYFDIKAATTEMQHETGAKTATLTVSYKSDKLTFDGSYTLTFHEEQGWKIETIKQDDGRHHPLMRLTKLEQK